jgi:hypothetical protein
MGVGKKGGDVGSGGGWGDAGVYLCSDWEGDGEGDTVLERAGGGERGEEGRGWEVKGRDRSEERGERREERWKEREERRGEEREERREERGERWGCCRVSDKWNMSRRGRAKHHPETRRASGALPGGLVLGGASPGPETLYTRVHWGALGCTRVH